MKLIAFVLCVGISLFSNSAKAHFYGNVQVYVYPHEVSAVVSNHWGQPIHCVGRVYGITQSGHHAFAWFNQVIPMGQYRVAYLTAPYYNPFWRGFSDIQCRLAPYWGW